MNLCKNHFTIRCDSNSTLSALLETFHSYSNYEFKIKDTSDTVLKCLFITSWYPDFDMMEQMVKTYNCWLKNEWQEEGGIEGVWIGYMDKTIHIKKLEWLNMAHETKKV